MRVQDDQSRMHLWQRRRLGKAVGLETVTTAMVIGVLVCGLSAEEDDVVVLDGSGKYVASAVGGSMVCEKLHGGAMVHGGDRLKHRHRQERDHDGL